MAGKQGRQPSRDIQCATCRIPQSRPTLAPHTTISISSSIVSCRRTRLWLCFQSARKHQCRTNGIRVGGRVDAGQDSFLRHLHNAAPQPVLGRIGRSGSRIRPYCTGMPKTESYWWIVASCTAIILHGQKATQTRGESRGLSSAIGRWRQKECEPKPADGGHPMATGISSQQHMKRLPRSAGTRGREATLRTGSIP